MNKNNIIKKYILSNNKAFTLIELLAVIIIMAIIMIIAIPSITSYIDTSRKESYAVTATGYLDGLRNKINSFEYPFVDTNATYWVPLHCIKFERGGDETPFGEFIEGYAVTTYNGSGYNYYFTSRDTANKGILLTHYNKITKDSVVNINENIRVQLGVGNREKILIMNENCDPEKLTEMEALDSIEEEGAATKDQGLMTDKIPPQLTVGVTYLTSESANLKINVRDNESGLYKNNVYKYCLSSSKEEVIDCEWTDFNNREEFLVNNVKTNKYLWVYSVMDNSNNITGNKDKIKEPYFFKDISEATYSVSPTGWAQSKTVTITYPEGYTNEYSVDGGLTWKEYNNSVVLKENGTVIARVRNGEEYITGTSQTVAQIDPTKPTVANFTYTATTNSVSIIATGVDEESEIVRYRFSIDDGETWSEIQESNTYTFNEVKTGTYKVRVRVINGTYLNNGENEKNYLDSEIQNVDTLEIEKPTYGNVVPTGWALSKTVSINYPVGYTNEYSIDEGKTWNPYTGVVTLNENGSVIARVTDGTNYVSATSLTVAQIDPSKPVSLTIATTKTSKSITVIATGQDDESDIAGYRFSIDNGVTWTPFQESNTYTFNDLLSGEYKVIARAINGTYGNNGEDVRNYLDSEMEIVSTSTIDKPTYNVSPAGWAKSKTVTISYPSGYTNEYSIDGGTTWKPYTSGISFSANGNIIARVNDGINYVTATSQAVTGIDTEKPTLSITTSVSGLSATVKISAIDGQSGLSSTNKYKYYLSTSSSSLTGGSWKDYPNDTNFTMSSSGGTYYIWVYPVMDGVGYINDSYTNNTTAYMIKSIVFVNPVVTFPYTGGVQTFTVPANGKYKIELWGAQGGTGVFSGSSYGCSPGKGAYTSGIITLTAGEVLYVHVGGKGTSGVLNTVVAASYNGGGGGSDGGKDDGAGSGGGATDVRLVSGAWNNATGLRSRIMVAGGGGGGSCVEDRDFATSNTLNNRHAAGLSNPSVKVYTFNDRNSPQSTPVVNQTTGYAFGYGITGEGQSKTDTHGQGGGGGGYWGGSGASDNGADNFYSYRSGGTGGSSYISGHTGCVAVVSSSSNSAKSGCTTGTTNNACSVHYSGKVFTNTVMKAGNQSMTSTSGGTETGHSGNGYGKITYMGE